MDQNEWKPWKHFSIHGEPKGQKRHRHRVVQTEGKKPFATTYDPSAKDKAAFALLASQFAPDVPLDVPLCVNLVCYMPYSKTHMGTGRNAGKPKPSAPLFHTKTPDIDNLAKFVYDALSGLFWRDDSIIISGTTTKMYSVDPETYVWIGIRSEDLDKAEGSK